MKNIEKLIAVAFVAVVVGNASAYVGRAPSACEPFSAWLPLQILFLLGIPAVLSYIAGRKSKEQTP